MMNDRKYRGGSVGAADAEPDVDPTACGAPGCPLRATVDYASGRFYCTGHAKALPHEWAGITARIHEQRGLSQFISELQQRINVPRKGDEPWHSFAARYWGTDTHCVPNEHECKRPQPYLYRMFGELQWRIQTTDNRPQPWQPPAVPGVIKRVPAQQPTEEFAA